MQASTLLPSAFGDRQARKAAVTRAAARAPSAALLAELEAQQAALPQGASAAQQRALETLARPGTAAVLTGQQVGLFLGPLYTIYKAATAVALAEALAIETGTPCVPIFWMATEDHDFA
ncbi:MAG TPA: bacillithiol biosynthesis BshC, partial [Polyangia bacterium]